MMLPLKNKSRFICTAMFAFSSLLYSCTPKDNATPTPSNPNNNNNTKFGEIIDIPGITQGVAGDGALDLKTTNEGLYMQVTKSSSGNNWIYRLQKGGSSTSDWTMHEQQATYFDWEPQKYNSEAAREFSIFFQTLSKNGYISINSNVPHTLENDNPNGSHSGELLYDNSPGAYQYAFVGSSVRVKQNNNLNKWDEICVLPTSGGINFAEAEPSGWDAAVWAAAGSRIYRITVNGNYTYFDVSSYANPDIVSSTIHKIRFSYDPLHKDVYFNCWNKVFKITDGKTLSLFYTIDNGANFLGGDFAIDNTYMYATDGTKKHLSLLTETNIIPASPPSTDYEEMLNHQTMVSAFQVGPIEVLKDPTDGYIYTISNCKLIKVSKGG